MKGKAGIRGGGGRSGGALAGGAVGGVWVVASARAGGEAQAPS